MKTDYNKIMENGFTSGAFLCAGREPANLMTISWGFAGVMWGEKVFITVIRDSRYTKELVEKYREFAVCVPYRGTMKKELAFCGSKSGREYNKAKELNIKMKPAEYIDTEIPEESEIVLECKLITSIACPLDILPEEIISKWYSSGDKHTLYIGKILNA